MGATLNYHSTYLYIAILCVGVSMTLLKILELPVDYKLRFLSCLWPLARILEAFMMKTDFGN